MKRVSPRAIISGAGTSLVDQIVVSATNFVTGVMIARNSPPEQFGLYMLGISAMFVAYELQAALVSTPYMVHYPHLRGRDCEWYTGSTLAHQAAFGLCVSLLLLMGGLLLARGIGPKEAAPVLMTLAGFGLLMMLREYVRRLCFARLDPFGALVLDVTVSALQLVGIAALAWSGGLSAALSFVIMGTAAGVGAATWLALNRASFAFRWGRIRVDLVMNWRFGRWVLLSGLLWALSMQLYPWVLTLFDSVAAAGIWAACMGVVQLANPVILGAQNWLGPKIADEFATRGYRGLLRYVAKISASLMGLILPFVLSMVLLGDRLVSLIYGEAYAGQGAVMALLGVNLLVMGLAFPVSRALFAAKRADLDFLANLVPVLILITVGIWLVESFGPLGGAASLLLANTASALFRIALFWRLVAAAQRSDG
jgi:O-antigen/teichoic acid export membrane protein